MPVPFRIPGKIYKCPNCGFVFRVKGRTCSDCISPSDLMYMRGIAICPSCGATVDNSSASRD